MKEEIGVGYYRLNIQSDGDKRQVDRLVRDFNSAVCSNDERSSLEPRDVTAKMKSKRDALSSDS
jgi:hypothetical protein